MGGEREEEEREKGKKSWTSLFRSQKIMGVRKKRERFFWVRFSGDHHFSLQSFKKDHILRIKGVPSSSFLT